MATSFRVIVGEDTRLTVVHTTVNIELNDIF